MKNIFSASLKIPTAAFFIALLGFAAHAKADMMTTTSSAPRVLQEALATRDALNIYDSKAGSGFNFAGGFFSGRASGVDPVGMNYANNLTGNPYRFDSTAELEGDARVYAVMLDGNYKFDSDLGSGLPLHPYLSSGVGMAMYDYGSAPTAASLASQGGSTAPLFRVGGGLTYQLSKALNMSLDYSAGFSGGGDQVFTTRSQQSTEMQSVNMGMHFAF